MKWAVKDFGNLAAGTVEQLHKVINDVALSKLFFNKCIHGSAGR